MKWLNRKILLLLLVLLFFIPTFLTDAQLKNARTIYALQERYRDEVLFVLKYRAYAQKALSEDYPNIAYLFVALAASESLHARNFKKLLLDLGIQVKEIPNREFEVSTTKENLRFAATQEIKEIDDEYPQLVKYIKPEKHEAAIRNIMYAWKGEKQHRNYLKRMLWGKGIFFRWLAKKIEKKDLHFFVCQRCGSSLTELPQDKCPICDGPVEHYKEVVRIR